MDTITYEGTLSGSRIEGKVISRNEDGSVTVEHPDGDGWTYRVRPEHIITDSDAGEEVEQAPRTVQIAINDNEGYAADQIRTHITLKDMLESIQDAIEEFGEDATVVLDNGQRYGASYGSFTRAYGNALEITDADACPECEASPGDNDHRAYDGSPHAWHDCITAEAV